MLRIYSSDKAYFKNIEISSEAIRRSGIWSSAPILWRTATSSMRHFSAAILLLSLAALAAARVDYTGYKVIRVNVENKETAELLHKVEKSNLFDFWNGVRYGNVDIMASPERIQALEKFLTRHELEHSVFIEDVQAVIDLSPMKPTGPKMDPKQGHNMDWTDYHTLEDIYGWLDYLETTYSFVSTEVIGQSYEGRDVRAVKVCTGSCDASKRAIYIDAGIHAREWIGDAVATYMLNELVTKYAAGTDTDLLDELDWYFIPSVNPDGYEYTWNTDRMWRKTRSLNDGSICIGTDANRNFDAHWNTVGTSDSPCSDAYHGETVFSEVEARNVRDFVNGVKDHVLFSNSIHSYSQLILLPYGYTSALPPNYSVQLDIANRANEALLAEHGKVYVAGNTYDTIYPASGLTLDWIYDEANIPMSVSMELRDRGLYGFILPADQIIPTGEEVWAFHKSAARDVIAGLLD